MRKSRERFKSFLRDSTICRSVKFVFYVYIVIIMINHMVIFLYINVKAVDKYHFFVS